MAQKIGIGWQVGGTTGWGVYGNALMLQSIRRGLLPVPVYVSQNHTPTPLEQRMLAPLQRQWFIEQQLFELGGQEAKADYPFLMGLGNDLTPSDVIANISGSPDVGVVFFERRDITQANIDRAKARFAKIIAGSSWNANVLRDLGFADVSFCPQGIDATLFHPAPRSGYLGDRFVVFSGGKLEFRKGQDIVIEAFRRFQQRHPDALLMLAWHNHWDLSVDTVRLSPYGFGAPERDAATGRWRFTDWLVQQGIPAHAILDLGEVAHDHMPQILREADVGVFPNRCEGGTNLVAMECMACGVPSILSANTGHQDLLAEEDVALALTQQVGVKGGASDDPSMFADWGESDPDEIVEYLEKLYTDKAKAQAIGASGAAFMAQWAWPDMIDALLKDLGLLA
jgi:glycosyltransferase involved in cell wall biosynthesis